MSKIGKRAIRITNNLVLKPLFDIISELSTHKPMVVHPTFFKINVSNKCAIVYLKKTRMKNVFFVDKIEFPKYSKIVRATRHLLILPKNHKLIPEISKKRLIVMEKL